MSRLANAQDQFRRAVFALALELPPEVHADFVTKANELMAAYDAQATSLIRSNRSLTHRLEHQRPAK